MRPKIDAEPTFDPLQLFTSEGPVEGTKPTNTALTRWRPTFVRTDDVLSPPRRRSSRVARFGLAAAASLAGGVLIGFASGYISAQRLTTPTVTAPALAVPSPQTAPPALVPDAPSPNLGTANAASEPRDAGPESRELPDGPRAQSTLDREPAGAPVEPRVPVATSLRTREGSIEVLSRPSGADVSLDGRIVGQTPLTIPNVQEGTHVIGIELSGFSRWATSVSVDAGRPTRIGASLTP